jgi:hypothetical protein
MRYAYTILAGDLTEKPLGSSNGGWELNTERECK